MRQSLSRHMKKGMLHLPHPLIFYLVLPALNRAVRGPARDPASGGLPRPASGGLEVADGVSVFLPQPSITTEKRATARRTAHGARAPLQMRVMFFASHRSLRGSWVVNGVQRLAAVRVVPAVEGADIPTDIRHYLAGLPAESGDRVIYSHQVALELIVLRVPIAIDKVVTVAVSRPVLFAGRRARVPRAIQAFVLKVRHSQTCDYRVRGISY